MESFLFKNNVLENYTGNKKSKDTYMHTINSSKKLFLTLVRYAKKLLGDCKYLACYIKFWYGNGCNKTVLPLEYQNTVLFFKPNF